MEKFYSVAIDGPSGAGKSTIAKAAAKASAVEEQRAAEDRAASVTVAVAAETAETSKA